MSNHFDKTMQKLVPGFTPKPEQPEPPASLDALLAEVEAGLGITPTNEHEEDENGA